MNRVALLAGLVLLVAGAAVLAPAPDAADEGSQEASPLDHDGSDGDHNSPSVGLVAALAGMAAVTVWRRRC